MTDDAGASNDHWGRGWDDQPAPTPGGKPKPEESGPDAGKPSGESRDGARPGAEQPATDRPGASKPAEETPPATSEPDPFAETFRARERGGGRGARREQAAGARYYVIGGNYYEGGEPPPLVGIRVGPVDARELAAARTDFQEPEFYPRAVEMLGQRGLVVLAYGLSDTGKRRAALNLLGRGAEPVAEIDPRADLDGLSSFEFEPGGRYLAMVGSETAGGALGRFALDRLRERLAECRCRLVLVVPSRLHVPSEQLGDYGVVCGDPVEAWFDAEKRHLDRYALMLGVAVLGGISHQAVVDAADRLHQSLAKVTDEDKTTERIFGTVRDQRAAAVEARVVEVMEETEFGDVPVKIVEFIDESWYSAVLHYVWEHKELMRPPLLRWMRQLCVGDDDEVRLRAATAAGDLCRHDFGYMWPHVIVPWARSDDLVLRRAAAYAAGGPAQDAALSRHVLGSLRKWAEDAGEPALRWTAAAAFGSYWIGRRFPDTALRLLGKMLEDDTERLGFVISDGMSVLFGAGREDGEFAAKVLGALLDWSADRKRTPASLGIFLNVAYLNELPGNDDEGGGWPSVLWVADHDVEMREAVVALFRRSLDDPLAKAGALEVIEHWTRRADEEPGIEPALGRLLRDLPVIHRDWRRLTIHLRGLASKRAERPSRAASRLLARLMAAEPVAAQ